MSEEANLLIKVYRNFAKTAPVLKYSGVLMLSISILALVAYFKLNNTEVFLYAIAIILVSFICYVFSAIIEQKDSVIRYGLYFFIYVIIFTLSACVLSFASFIFFQKPIFYKRWFPDMTIKKIDTVDSSKFESPKTKLSITPQEKERKVFRNKIKPHIKNDNNDVVALFGNKSENNSGTVTFDYSNNDGRFQIGKDKYLFETMWSRASKTAIYAYKDSPTIQNIALATDQKQLENLSFPNNYDTTSRVRMPQIGEIVIWKNKNGYYAATKIISVKDRTGGDSADLLTIEYIIQIKF